MADSAVLPKWLASIVRAGSGRVVIVPGGGPWADAVREQQKREGFDDREAHGRALRAMEAYGTRLCRMNGALIPANDPDRIERALEANRVPVWMPFDMVIADPAIAPSWDVTSDSLAAWLARRLRASRLMVVKSMERVDPVVGIAEMSRRGWVDPCFAQYCYGADFEISLLGLGECERFEKILSGQA